MNHTLRMMLAGLLGIACAGSLCADTIYVDAVNGTDANSGWTPDDAFQTLQAAVDASLFDGDEIIAAPGVYDTGGRAETDYDPWAYDPLMNRVHIPHALTLRSSAGPGQTFIAGQPGSGAGGLGWDAVRCVLATASGTVIEGFTITNGHTAANGWSNDSMGGGALLGESYNVVISNCLFVGNAACYGGGVFNGKALSCRFIGNTADEWGGGAEYGEFENCLFTGNHAGSFGGGASDAALIHCTVVGNSADGGGGGTAWTPFYNSIVYYNTAGQNANYHWGYGFEGSCTFPIPNTGENVLATEPLFAATNNWSDLRLTINSLCIDGGSDGYPTTTALDLDGSPRVSGVLPDIGAFEWQGDVLPVVSFTDPAETVGEDAGTLVIGVTLSTLLPEDATFGLLYSGSASALADYTNAPATVTFPAGVTETNVDLLVLDDALPEYPETLVLALVPTNAFRFGHAQHTVNILDNDGMPEVTRFLLAGGAAGIDTNFVDYIDLEVLNDPVEYQISEQPDFAGASWIEPGEDEPIVCTLSAGYGDKTVWFRVRKPDGAGGYLVSLPVSDAIYYGPPLAVAIDQPGADVYSTGNNGEAWYGVTNAVAQGGSLARSASPAPGYDWANSWLDLTITVERPAVVEFTMEQFGNGNVGFAIDGEGQNLDNIWMAGPHVYCFEVEAGTHTLQWYANVWNAGPGDYCTLDAVTIIPLPPRVWFEQEFASAREGETVDIGVRLEWPLDDPVTVNYSVGGTATIGPANDYTVLGVPGEVVIPAGATQAVFTVTVIDDAAPEHTESADFRIDDGAGYRVGQPDLQTVNIWANDGLIDFLALWLEGEAAETTNRVIRVDGAATDLPSHLMVSEDPDFTGAEWIVFTTNAPMTFALSEGFGTKTVYAKVRIPDGIGGWEESNVLSASIRFLACTLSEALDTDRAVTTTDPYNWIGQTNVTHDGVDAARSHEFPNTYEYANSYMSTTVEGPVIVSFWWKISGYNSYSGYYDNSYLNFLVDGAFLTSINGEQDWTRVTHTLPAGTHTLAWRYDKNYYFGGPDCGWVDQLTVTNDWPEVTFSTPGQDVNETDGTVYVQVQMNRQEANAVTVPFQAGGSATPGADYTLTPEFSVTFPPYETVQTITVTLQDDATPEATETARFTLVPTNGVLVGLENTHDLAILPNDGAPVVTLFQQQGGSGNVTNRDIVLSVAASGDPSEYRLSEDPAFGDASWLPYTASPAFALSPGYGVKPLWIQVRANVGGYGWVLSDPVNLVLQAQPSLAEALNVAGGQVASPSASPWFGQLAVSRDGAAAQSGPIPNYGQSSCILDLTGEGTVGFWWKVSSEGSFDYLSLYADGLFISDISGTGGDWQYVTHTFTGLGAHTLEWRYTKDGSVSSGSDCGWVDQVDLSGWTHTQVATPQFSPPSNTIFNVTLDVTLACATPGAQIRYTLDGSAPDETSSLYTNAITLSATTTIKAKGFLVGAPTSDLSAATYVRSNATPGFDPPSGTSFINSLDVTISSAVAGVTIYYTLDGSDPGTNSAVYAASVTLTDTAVIKAVAYDGDTPVSAVASATYTLQPVDAPAFTPGGGLLFDETLGVALSCGTAGAVIRCTLDGSEPTAESPLYTAALTLSNAMTVVRARAFKAGMAPSPIATAAYMRRGGIVVWGYNNYGQCSVPADLTDAAAFALGTYHGLALRSDGTVQAWGYNGYGQCNVPAGLSNVVALAAGSRHSLALRADGTVAAWGYNGYGQCNVPAGLSGAVALAAGANHSLALLGDGTVVGWGNNGYGQCNAPAGLSNAVALAAGYYHSAALRFDGTVTAWGNNWYSQCDVPAGLEAVAVAAGIYHSLALRPDGTVAAWGNNWYGETIVPAGLSNAVAVAAGQYHSAALRSDGSVTAWGYNEYGQCNVPTGQSHAAVLQAGGDNSAVQFGEWTPIACTPPSGTWIPPGDGTLAVRLWSLVEGTVRYTLDGSEPTAASPVYGAPILLSDTTTLRAALFQGAERIGAIRTSAYIKQTATPFFTPEPREAFIPAGGSLAVSIACADAGAVIRYTLDGSEPTAASLLYTTPLNLSGKTRVVARAFQDGRAASAPVSALYAEAGRLHGWGHDGYYPYAAPENIAHAIGLAAGAYHTLALLPGGTVAAWGQDNYGAVSGAAGISNAVAIAAGYDFSLALMPDGTVTAWGYNGNGECDPPPDLDSAVAVAAGYYHAAALLADGSVRAWGNNGYSQCDVPAGLETVAVAAGAYHTLALRSDGTVAAWGYNDYGQCTVPADLSNVVAVAAGYIHSAALRADGTVALWGNNDFGQCMVPTDLGPVAVLAAGMYHNLALRTDGSIALWGSNSEGESELPADFIPRVARIAGNTQYTLVGFGVPALISATPPSGTWIPPGDGALTVYLAGAAGGTIHYTFDGSEPSGASPVYTGGLPVAADTLIKARLFLQGEPAGETLVANYVKQVAVPVFAPVSGTQFIPEGGALAVSLTCATPDAEIRYTLDGSDPTPSSGIYTAPLQLDQTTTTRARAFKAGFAPSDLTMAIYARAGDFRAAGDNSYGQTTLPSPMPAGVRQATVGQLNGAVVLADGTVQAWGYSGYGLLNLPGNLTNVLSIALGYGHGVALHASGTVSAWGYNGEGQCAVPAGLLDVVAIDAGDENSLALRADGSVVVWGYDGYGVNTVPTDLTNTVAASLGNYHALGVHNDGTVTAWGYNAYGQCTIPDGLSNAVAVAAGDYFSLALLSDGTVMAWGDNGSGQCAVPNGLSNVVAIAAGDSHSVALTADGRVVAWGSNNYGQCAIPPGLPPVAAIAAAGNHTLLRYGPVVPVSFTPPSGMLVPGSGYPFPVRLHGATLGGAIRYTLDGSAPTATSPAYDGPIMLGDATTVRVALFVNGAQVGGAANAFFPLLPGGVVFNAVTVNATPAGAGTAAGGGLVRKFGATTVTATVTDTEKYAFARWLRNGVAVSTLPVYTFTVTENCLMTAVFELRTFPVTVTIAPSGLGWVNGAGWWSYGVSNTLTAHPYSGCQFLGWEETSTGAPLGTAPTYTTAITAPLGVTARFKELVSSHTVTTRSEPPGLAVVGGAGVYANSLLATFTAPAAVTNGETRQVFSHFTRNGNWATTANPWNWWMSRTDPETVEVAAVYIAQPLAPKVRRVSSNLTTPVPITDNMQISVVFDRAMNPAAAPMIAISNRASAVVKTLPAGGSWSGWYVNDDTYRCPPVAFARGEDGDCDLRVAGARDTFGGLLAPTNAWSFRVDATPPPLPTLRLTGSNDTWFTVGWDEYAPPTDLNGFRIYVGESFFTNLASVSPTTYYWSGARSYTRYGIALDTTYWVAVAPMDQAGNTERIVAPLAVRIPRAVPPPVALTVTPTGADAARLDWGGYPGNSFGFAGFRVYRETAPFVSVSNLTPIATLGKYVRSHAVGSLDRAVTNWFAVVGYNNRDEMIPEVAARPWSDPFRGRITQNTTIGAPGTVTEILGPLTVAGGATLTVPAGATLAFRPGAGIAVEQGALVANGTALNPIRFTGTNDTGSALAAGAWDGVTLGAQAGASILRHVWIDYGRGLTVAGCAPTIDACSARYNTPAALRVQTGGTVNTADALLLYNGAGLLAEPGATLTVTRSIVRNNQTNAWALAGAAIMATEVWWGAAEPATVTSNLVGAVAHLPVLTAEPLLTPAADAVDGNRNVGVPQVTLALAARVAEAMQISEDSSFTGAFFDAFASPHTVALSAGGGVKTLYIRFRNSAGQLSATVALPINYITGGPQVTGANIQEGSVLRRPFRVTVHAASGLGVSALRLLVDGTPVASTNGQTSLSAWWDIRSLAAGTHRVRIEAEDSRGQLGVSAFNVRVAIDPPPNPVLTAPTDGLLTVAPTVNAAGTAEPFMPVVLRRNGAAVLTVYASSAGTFAAVLPLVEGENRIVATVADAFGTGRSAERTVVRDSGAPAAPTLQSNGYKQGTGLQLAWLHPGSGEVPHEYRVVYGPTPFATANAASNTTGWTRGTQTSLKPLRDGRWYFAVEGRDLADNRSPLSNVLTNDYDATPPAFTIAFDKPSPAGTGPLTATIEASETLAAKPTVIVNTPAGTGPTMLSVVETAPSRYACVFNVQASAGSGVLNYRVSGADLTGNQTTAATPTGPTMTIDTRGPGATLSATPAGLIQVTNVLPMQVTLTLDEAPAAAPVLRFAPPESATIDVTLAGSGTNWLGAVDLLPSMGSGIATFLFSADDPLGNTGTQLGGVTQVELYNTSLPEPPLRVTDLRASVYMPTGIVQLVWLPVAEAEFYTLRRQRGYTGSDPDTVIAEGITGAGYTDLPAEDDFYRYTVTATRCGASAQPSPVALGLSDRTPPPAPTNLTATLANTGVRVAWEYAVSGEQAAKFRVWRNGAILRNNLGATVREIIDNPAKGDWTYGVSALDLSGNESFAPSNATINLALPAPQRADATVGASGAPVLTWQTRAEHVGVNIYRNGVKLNAAPLTGGSFTDAQLSGTTRTLYEVRGTDAEGRESASRLLPVMHAAFGLTVNPAAGGSALTRYFDVAEIAVSNRTTDAALELAGVTVTRASAGTGETAARTVSVETSAAPRGTARIPVVLPCAAAIAAQTYTLRLTQALDDPSASVVYERVIVRPAPVPPTLTIELSTTNQPLAGAGCVYQARVHNRGQEAIDLVMWRDATPGDLSIRVLDAAGTVVNRRDAMMAAASLNRSDDGHRGFLTILPGASVLVNMPEIVIPEALGGAGQAMIEVVAQRIYWRCGESDELLSGPLQGRVTITPTLTPYTAFGLPERSLYVAGETLVVTGYAFERVSGARATHVPVHVGLALGEYVWFAEAQTDAAGDFRAEWPVAAGVSGWFDIWAAHPAVKDRLNHGRAAVHQVYFRPNAADLRSAANDVLTIGLNVYNPGEFAYSNLTSVFTAWRMEGTNPVPLAGSVVTGWVDQVETLSIGAFRQTPVTLKLAPTEDAPARLMARFEIVTDEGLRIPFEANVGVSQPLPLLQVTQPASGYVDMSLDRGKLRSTDVQIRNDGFKPLLGVKMAPPQSVPWMQVALSPGLDGSFALPDLAPGASYAFQVIYAPGEDVEMKYYSDALVITGTNSAVAKTINLYAKITSDQKGSLAFAVRNTLNQPVPDAAIRLRSALDGSERSGIRTDANGEIEIGDLMEGRWHWQVSASGHGTQAGTVAVEANGLTETGVVLNRELVTVTFSVVPVPFTDRYTIKIEQTFSTHVPAPVLVVDPVFMQYDNVLPGFETTFTATAKNYGLIKLEDFTVSGSYQAQAQFIPSVTFLPELAPMQQVEIPYKVVYLGSGEQPVPLSQPAPLSLPVQMALAGGPAAASSGPVVLGGSGGYDPCRDDFGDALMNLMSQLAGRYGCIDGTTLANAMMVVQVLLGLRDDHAGDADTVIMMALCFSKGTTSTSKSRTFTEGPGNDSGNGFPDYNGCFAAGTAVRLADGSSRPIESIRAGDVLATGSGPRDRATVLATFVRDQARLRVVRLDGGRTLRLTDEHLVWVDGAGWKQAQHVRPGERLAVWPDASAPVIENVSAGAPATVYTLELREETTFFADGVLVQHLCGAQVPGMRRTGGGPPVDLPVLPARKEASHD